VSGAVVLLAELVAAAALYHAGARRVRGWPPWRGACFAAGLAALGAALLALDAGRSVTAHMAQHLVLAFVAAPLLVLGSPLALVLRATRARGALRGAWLARPGVGWLALVALMALSQLPAVYDATAGHPLLHVAEHVAWLAAAVLFWRVVLLVGGGLALAAITVAVAWAAILREHRRQVAYEQAVAR
jgi:putative membrane protein